MNPDTAEMTIVEPAVEPPLAVSRPTWLARLRADPARMAAVHDSWRALLYSRVLVWTAGIGAILAFGFGPIRGAFNPPGLTRGFGRLGDLLAAPAARWDASWYLVIAHYGYRPDLGSVTSSRTAFFPLYPLVLKAISGLAVPPVLAGVALSLLAFAPALYGIHRLTTLELGAGPAGASVARLAVALTAFAPMAFFFTAVYSESLYLALSVGVFWCARQGRWAGAAALAALAGATRSTGIVLALPVLILYLYGPRRDRPPDLPAPRLRQDHAVHPRSPTTLAAFASLLRPRYRLRRDILWLALIPVGIGLYLAYLALDGGSATMPFHAQQVWSRHFAGPYLGVWDGARAAFQGARQLLSGQSRHAYFLPVSGSPLVAAGHNTILFVFLTFACVALAGVLRRLPLAYGAYVLAALALPLSYPVAAQPLMSLPRFLVVLFPLTMWLAAWLAPRPRVSRATLLASALLMSLFAAQFATWHWVA
jgi:hypothetical protein